ncbi:MAG: hypothetical protein A2283_13075 [Lentisphaerae bacterium RIFOXYA12_FULL_48_11]|nr:MAG: hypothetical protein A2283_13075 [Lentisphaerae bacterium RIFOXYA12_FULL_48_11]
MNALDMTEKKKTDADDSRLVRAAKDGNLAAFERLVTSNERRIYGLARRITGSDEDAEDVTQQTFLSAMQNLSSFRESAAFSTWLTTIAVNAALKIVRKRQGLPTTSLDEATKPDVDRRIPHPEYIADWRQNPEQLVQNRETRRILDSAIAELDPGLRAVFLLRDVENLSVKDTANALHLKESNVKVRLLRARLKLREKLTLLFGDPDHRYLPAEHNNHKISHLTGART